MRLLETIRELELELAGWPSFRELAERLDVHPNVLRDDIDELLARGVLETRLVGVGLRVYHALSEPPPLGPRLRPGPLT